MTAEQPVLFHVCRSLRRVRNHAQESVHPFRAFGNSTGLPSSVCVVGCAFIMAVSFYQDLSN